MKTKLALLGLIVSIFTSVRLSADPIPPCCDVFPYVLVSYGEAGPGNPVLPWTTEFFSPMGTNYVIDYEPAWVPYQDGDYTVDQAGADAIMYAFAEWYAAWYAPGSGYVINSSGYIIPTTGSDVVNLQYASDNYFGLFDLMYDYPVAYDYLVDPPTATPEPSSLALFMAGIIVLPFFVWRMKMDSLRNRLLL